MVLRGAQKTNESSFYPVNDGALSQRIQCSTDAIQRGNKTIINVRLRATILSDNLHQRYTTKEDIKKVSYHIGTEGRTKNGHNLD